MGDIAFELSGPLVRRAKRGAALVESSRAFSVSNCLAQAIRFARLGVTAGLGCETMTSDTFPRCAPTRAWSSRQSRRVKCFRTNNPPKSLCRNSSLLEAAVICSCLLWPRPSYCLLSPAKPIALERVGRARAMPNGKDFPEKGPKSPGGHPSLAVHVSYCGKLILSEIAPEIGRPAGGHRRLLQSAPLLHCGLQHLNALTVVIRAQILTSFSSTPLRKDRASHLRW